MTPTLGRGTIDSPYIASADRKNYGDRGTALVDTIVIHVTQAQRDAAAITAGAPPSAVPWFRNPVARASAHYVVSSDGLVFACVPEAFSSWHAGNAAVNHRSVGVEVEGLIERRETWTPEVMATLVALCAAIAKRHGVAIRHQIPGIVGHADVPDPEHPDLRGGLHHHRDPGPHFPLLAFLDALRAELTPPAAGT